jgi:hypothetical protein
MLLVFGDEDFQGRLRCKLDELLKCWRFLEWFDDMNGMERNDGVWDCEIPSLLFFLTTDVMMKKWIQSQISS